MDIVTDAGDHLEVLAEGETANDLVAALKAAFSYPRYHYRHAIWYFTQNNFKVSLEQLGQVTEYIRANYPKDAPRTRRAIVVPPGLNAGFAEVWASGDNKLPYDVKVFHDEAEARAWIRNAPVA